MEIAFKIMMYTFMLNLAAGIIVFSIPTLPVQYTGVINPIADQTQGQAEMINALGGNVTLPSTTASASNVKDILLDAIFIGKIEKITNGVYTILFGFPKIIQNTALVFTPEEDSVEYISWVNTFNGVLVTIISLSYAIGVFFLWTGKRLNT